MKSFLSATVVALALAVALPPAIGAPVSGKERALPWEPRPMPSPSFSIREPHEDPVTQRHTIEASSDGTELFIEVWLPVGLDSGQLPEEVPTVLSLQPYTDVGEVSGDNRAAMETLVTRGYAYAQAHMRGTKASGGCWDIHGEKDRGDVSDILDFVAGASWSNGDIGLLGISNPAASALLAAGLADPDKTRGLKAVVAGTPVTSLYEPFARGGVPRFMPTAVEVPLWLAMWSSEGQISTLDNRPGERQVCWPGYSIDNATWDGSVNDFSEERELRRGAANIKVPVLMAHGLHDREIDPHYQVGFFDQIPDTTPKVGVFGSFAHEWPDGDDWADMDAGHPDPADQKSQHAPHLTRADWQAMLLAWFDHYLKGIDAGVETWPTVQVQDSEGQWRAEPDWPQLGGREGRLALGAGGKLGAANPTGATSYLEGSYRNSHLEGGYPAGASQQFVLDVEGRLEIAGQPVLELWVSLDRPDAHIAVTLDAYDPSGKPIPFASTSGFRSAQHLDPYVGNRFAQRSPRLAPMNEPLPISVPLSPRDIVVPAGGRLVLTVSGSAPIGPGLETYTGVDDGFLEPSQLSGTATTVTILHGCEHPSLLRFDMPAETRQLLNVREDGESDAPLKAVRSADGPSDGGGVATRAPCGGR